VTADGKLHLSSLKHMSRSAQHYLYWRDHEYDQTPAMRFGSLVHAIILGGEYRVFPGADRRAKGWTAWEQENTGIDARGHNRLLLTETEHDRGWIVAQNVLTNLRQIDGGAELLDGQLEHTIDWSFRGRPARSTLDVLGPGRIVDLKTTTNAQPDKFRTHAERMLYHAQMAFYREAVGTGPECFVIAAEVSPPYAVSVDRLTERTLQRGLQCCIAWAEQLDGCERSGVWPGYSQSIGEWDIEDEPTIDFETDETGGE
jgi:hypothetical protein